MIYGIDVKQIVKYLPIDRAAEGYSWVEPKDGEMFVGHPYGFHTTESTPFIEVVRNGQTLKTINCTDIAEIEFQYSGVTA